MSKLKTKEDYRVFFRKMFYMDISDENSQIDYGEEIPAFSNK